MKTIYLWVKNEGWMQFDFDAEETKKALTDRNIVIGNSAVIGYYAEIGDLAEIGDKEIILKSIFITGSKHTVNWWGKDIINIGCHQKKISWWAKNYKIIGEKEGYTLDEIEEYHQYILICQKLQKNIILSD